MRRNRMTWVLLAVLAGLSGCQARQMVGQYLSFDSVVTDLYEKHVLGNLARRDAGRTMVQINYQSFNATLNVTTSMAGQMQFFANPQNAAGTDGTSISLNAFRQSFEPNITNSASSGLGITSVPAVEQEAVRALYDEQVNRPEEERIFHRTTHPMVAMRAYCQIRTAQGDLYYVPQEKRREFSDFVHRVSFYKVASPVPPPSTLPSTATSQPAVKATATATATTTATAG